MTQPQAFELLQCFRHNDCRVLGKLPVRATASPLTPSCCTSYVVCKRLCDATSVDGGGADAIAVSFQSILNSDVWWSPQKPNEGVASRPMSRTTRCAARTTKVGCETSDSSECGSDGGKPQSHGYRGRMYTLVGRAPGSSSEPRTKRQRGRGDGKFKVKYVAIGDVSIVHAWRAADEDQMVQQGRVQQQPIAPPPPPPKLAAMPPPLADEVARAPRPESAAAGDDDILRYLTPQHSLDDVALRPDAPIEWPKRPRCFGVPGERREVVTLSRHLRVKGDLHCEGFIFGQLATSPRNADYAEWFLWDETHLAFDADGGVAETPPPGSVVQLRSPEQKLTLDTSASGPVLIVSTSPSVAAGLPVDPAVADRGALVAFLGQVPVRCRGIVKCGDQLVPSGLDDGTAVALEATAGAVPTVDALGVAMEDSPSSNKHADLEEGRGLLSEDSEHVVLCFVRWNHAVRRELNLEMEKVVDQMHGTFLSVLVYATAFVAAGVVALLAALLVVRTADTTGKAGSTDRGALARHDQRLRSWIYFLALLSFILLVALVAVFTTAVPHLRLLAAAGAFLLGLLSAAEIAASSNHRHSNDYTALTFLLLVCALLYHALLCFAALKLRYHQTQPKSIVTCSPTCFTWARRLLPCCCILGIFLCIFLQ